MKHLYRLHVEPCVVVGLWPMHCLLHFSFIFKHKSVFNLPLEIPQKFPNRSLSIFLLRVMNSVLELFWMLSAQLCSKGNLPNWEVNEVVISQMSLNQCKHRRYAASRFPLLRLAWRAGKPGQGVRLLFWQQHGLKSAQASHETPHSSRSECISCLTAFCWNRKELKPSKFSLLFHLYHLAYQSVSFLKQ